MYYNQYKSIKMIGGRKTHRKCTCRCKVHRGGRKTHRVHRGGKKH